MEMDSSLFNYWEYEKCKIRIKTLWKEDWIQSLPQSYKEHISKET